ncbi:MAG TPA: hypothetical protein VIF62_28330, partial [Labilithrix sp.]
NQRCPKCDGKKIWVVEAFRIPTETAQGQVLPVVPHQETGSLGFLALARVKPVGAFDVYLCAGCGYSELWASGLDELKANAPSGVRLLDSSTQPAGPFR